jgi:hypothetical protein
MVLSSYEQIVSELALAMRRLHDSFVALAGRLQTVHNSVETQKEQYLNLRKYFLKDSTNVFEEHAKKSAGGGLKPSNSINVSPGPTPFSGNYIFYNCGVVNMICQGSSQRLPYFLTNSEILIKHIQLKFLHLQNKLNFPIHMLYKLY